MTVAGVSEAQAKAAVQRQERNKEAMQKAREMAEEKKQRSLERAERNKETNERIYNSSGKIKAAREESPGTRLNERA